MSVWALGVRERSFKTVLGGFDPAAVRAALEAAATQFETLEAEIAGLREQHAEALGEIDRMGGFERSLLRSCVAAEEDALIRCGAARRYATRVIAAAQEQAAAQIQAPVRERDRISREIDALQGRRRDAAHAIEALIAGLGRVAVPDIDGDPDAEAVGEEAATPAVKVPEIAQPVDVAPVLEMACESTPARPAPRKTPGDGVPSAEPAPIDLSFMAPGVACGTSDDPADADADAQAVESAPEASPDLRGETPRRSRVTRFRAPIAAGSAAALLLVLQGSTGMPRFRETPTTIAAASFAPSAEPATPPGADGITPSVAAATPAPAAAPLTLHIKPLRTCWVRVIVDDRTDARELQPGEDIVLEAWRSIVLRAGDAGALSVEVNGRVLPPLGLNGQVVERRFTASAAGE